MEKNTLKQEEGSSLFLQNYSKIKDKMSVYGLQKYFDDRLFMPL